MPEQGWFKVWRGWRDNPVLSDAERRDAWLWLIENAAWKPVRVRINGRAVVLDRGELSFSVRFLADQWGWSKSRVDRFLGELRAESMIATRAKIEPRSGTNAGTASGQELGQGQAIITICNYDKYQSDDDGPRDSSGQQAGTVPGTDDGTELGQQRDKEEEGKKERNIPTNQPTSPTRARAREDAAPRLDGWTDEQIGDVADRAAEAAGLSLSTAKRRAAAVSTVARWLEGWQGVDVEADLLAPIRAFLFSHDGPTHSLARFDATVLDRKARAKPKPAATSSAQPAAMPRDGEGEDERRIRARMANEDGSYPYLIERSRLALNCSTLTVVCPDEGTAASLVRLETVGGGRLLMVARNVAGMGIETVTITTAERIST